MPEACDSSACDMLLLAVGQSLCCLLQVVIEVVDKQKRPTVPPADQLPGARLICQPDFEQLLAQCWDSNEASRPSFDHIISKLRCNGKMRDAARVQLVLELPCAWKQPHRRCCPGSAYLRSGMCLPPSWAWPFCMEAAGSDRWHKLCCCPLISHDALCRTFIESESAGSSEDCESDASGLKASDSDGSAMDGATPWRTIAPEEMPQPSGALEVTAALPPAQAATAAFKLSQLRLSLAPC